MTEFASRAAMYFESLPGWAKLIIFLSFVVFIAITFLAPRSKGPNPDPESTSSSDAGLVQVRPLVSNQDLQSFLAKATQRIRILVPWFVDPLSLLEMLKEKAQDENFILHIILLEPSSQYLKKRGEVVQPGQQDYGRQESIRTLMALSQAFKGSTSRNVRVFAYDSLPSIFIAQCDSSALIGFHLNTGTALRNPHLEIALLKDQRETVLGKMVREELDKLLTIAKEIDLTTLKQTQPDTVAYSVIQPK